MRKRQSERFPGTNAHNPIDIPIAGWKQVVGRVWEETRRDQVPLLAAGVAFWGFISLFPAMVAATALYGLVADPATVTRQAEAITEALPRDAASLIVEQMRAISSQSTGALNLSLLISVLLALWSSSAATSNLLAAVNTAYDEEETRSYLHRKALALLLSLGAVAFVLISVGLIALAPMLLDTLVPDKTTRGLLWIGRWAVLVVAALAGAAVIYKLAPDRDSPRLSWVSVGSVVATAGCLLASVGFSMYVETFGRYGRTYGALAGVAILMLWLWISALIVLVGAELNAEAEQQTVQDTTVGEAVPVGQRNALKADTRPGAKHRNRRGT